MDWVRRLGRSKLPGRKTLLQLVFAKRFFKLVDDPNATINVFKVGDVLNAFTADIPREQVREYLYNHPYYSKLLAHRYIVPIHDIAALKNCAPGTLGQAYYQHMTSNGLTPDFFPMVEVKDEQSYMEMRGRQTHDLWHVITGYDTSVVGEISLQAVYLGQSDADSFASMLISAGMLYAATKEPKIMGQIAVGVGEGYAMGRAAGNLMAVNWEAMWDRPLADIQAELNIMPKNAPQLVTV